jgi:hypothetical protein
MGFITDSNGGGRWSFGVRCPSWTIRYQPLGLKFKIAHRFQAHRLFPSRR